MKKLFPLYFLLLLTMGNRLSAQSIPNHSFESWPSGANAAPGQWADHGGHIMGFQAVTQSSDHYEGMYSVRLECKIQGMDTTKGGTSTLRPDSVEGLGPAFPVPTQVQTLKGYYKYSPSGNDSAQIMASLHKTGYQHSQGWGDLLAFAYVHLPAAATFTPFSTQTFWYDSIVNPDSGFIEMSPFKAIDFTNGSELPVTGNSVLWVDALSFDNWIVGSESEKQVVNELVIFPNPSKGDFRCRFSTTRDDLTEVRVFDMQGRILKSFYGGKLEAGVHEINLSLSELESGNYLFLISTTEGYRAEQLVIRK